MCDYVAGELLLSFHRSDPAGLGLLEQIYDHGIPHVSVIETLEGRLESLGLKPRQDSMFSFVRLAVPHGEEAFKIGYLHFFYKHALIDALSKGLFEVGNTVHDQILGRSDFHPQVGQNGILSVTGPTASAKPATAFVFEATHSAYKTQMGWPGSTKNGSGRRVVVVDTGVDSVSHYNVVDGRNFLDDLQKLDVSDEHGHGTAMTSVINDIAPGAEIVVYKVADKNGIANEWSLLAALQAASGAHIINISMEFGLGDLLCPNCGRASRSTRSGLFENMLSQLAGSASAPVLVAAAGNGGSTELSFPARYDSVIAVESIDSTGMLAGFSNRSTINHESKPHSNVFVLPGGQGQPGKALSEYIGSSGSGRRHGGTSAAAAYASGLIARIWSTPPHTASPRTAILAHLSSQASQELPGYLQATFGHGLMQCR